MTIALFVIAHLLSLVGYPQSERAVAALQELVARVFLLLLAALLSVLWLRDRGGWRLPDRWQIIALLLAWLGLLFAVADPAHRVLAEANWIRYWTSGVLFAAGMIGLWHSMKGSELLLARLIGLGLGSLLILAAADEIFQLHETLGATMERSGAAAGLSARQDLPTLLVAAGAVLGFGLLLVLYRWTPRLLADIRSPRFALPMILLGLAVVTFATAMVLDSFDRHLIALAAATGLPQGYETIVPEAPFWHYLLDISVLANSLEEILEHFSAVCLLMTMGSLFFVTRLGFARPPEPEPS